MHTADANSAAEVARQRRAKAEELRAEAGRLDAQADLWELGADGERMTTRILAPLALRGWVVLHDLAVPGRRVNIDHVLIGPFGIVVIDSKNFKGQVTERSGSLWHNGYPLNRQVEALASYADVIRNVLGPAQAGVPVRMVMCVHRAEVNGFLSVDGCTALPADRLRSWIDELEPVLALQAVPGLRNAITAQLPPRMGYTASSSSSEHSPSTGLPLPLPRRPSRHDLPPYPFHRRRPSRRSANNLRAAGSTLLVRAGLVVGAGLLVLVAAPRIVGYAARGATAGARAEIATETAKMPTPITGTFSCQSDTHTYLLTATSSPGTMSIVDAQVPRGVREQVTGTTIYVTSLTPGETVQLSLAGSTPESTALTAPSTPC